MGGFSDLTPENENVIIDDSGNRVALRQDQEGVWRVPVDSINASIDATNLVIEDSGIAKDTVIGALTTPIHSYLGSGLFYGVLLNLEDLSGGWYIRITIDGNDIFFPPNGLNTSIATDQKGYDIRDLEPNTCLGLGMHDNTFRYEPAIPIKFNTSVVVSVSRITGTKKFYASFWKVYKVT